jgi:hypothetical protein
LQSTPKANRDRNIVIGASLVILVLLSVYVIQSQIAAAASSTTGVPPFTITSLVEQYNGQTQVLIPTSFDNYNSSLSSHPSVGVDVIWIFNDGGQGLPNSTFSITPLQPGFGVVWVQYCASSACSDPGYTGDGYLAYSSVPDGPPDWSGCGACVALTSVSPGTPVYVLMSLAYEGSSYDGPLTLGISP